jgi:hypothetical protein
MLRRISIKGFKGGETMSRMVGGIIPKFCKWNPLSPLLRTRVNHAAKISF